MEDGGSIYRLLLAAIVVANTVTLWAATNAPSVVLDPRQPYLRVASDLQVGNKGEETFDVSLTSSECGDLWVFDHAQLVVHRQRFADVQLVALPEAGCQICKPGVVRWYHEPTGHLEFSVQVYRRKVELACPQND